ncbi:MAG: aminotransferase class III-fold pyridoxal phosphate-dependent enzyme, partial [Zetaproteobacteria bacterium]
GGREEIMRHVAPDGPVYQAGTLSGNPLAMRAGIETLKKLRNREIYAKLEATTKKLVEGLVAIFGKEGIPCTAQRFGSMFTLFMTEQAELRSHADVKRCDLARFARFFHAMLDRGVYWPPSQFEAAFVSAAHTDKEVEQTLAAAEEAARALKEGK